MFVDGNTKVLGIFGNPISHTLSPVIHNTLSEMLGLNDIYVPFCIKNAEDVEAAVKGAYAMNVQGINVTVPYKQEVMKYLVEVDCAAKKIGAVNTLVRVDGGFKGYNTDMLGLTRAITAEGISLEGEKIIVLGAGGASRAVCYMCLNEGASVVYLVNRSFDKAKALCDDMNKCFNTDKMIPVAADDYKSIPTIDELSSEENNYEATECGYIAFQCTSLGLKEGDPLLVEDVEFYDMIKTGYDLIYNPAETPFTRRCKNHKIKVSNGITMLLYQGIIAYELWNDVEVSNEAAERVLTELKKSVYGDNIVLVGYMGSGKTTVAKAIAEKTGKKYIDTDEYIEEKEGITISEIFKNLGEAAFRKMETEAIKELETTCSNSVIATGGGIVLRDGNAEILKRIGKVFYLSTTPEETFKRIKGDTSRPLLQNGTESEIKKRIADMIEKRRPYYVNASDKEVDVTSKSVEFIVQAIL